MHVVNTLWFGLDPKGAGLAASHCGPQTKGNQSLPCGEILAGDMKPPEASILQGPTRSGHGQGALEGRAWSHPPGHALPGNL